jgi:hypothetical protein
MTNGESTVLFGRAVEFMGICSEEMTRTLARQVDSPPWQGPWAWCFKRSRLPGYEIHYKIDHPLYSPDLAPCDILLILKYKKMPKWTKICWHSWHPKQHDNDTATVSEKLFSRLFPSVRPSSHEINSFTRRVFRRRQQPLVKCKQILLSQSHSGN